MPPTDDWRNRMYPGLTALTYGGHVCYVVLESVSPEFCEFRAVLLKFLPTHWHVSVEHMEISTISERDISTILLYRIMPATSWSWYLPLSSKNASFKRPS